jgi:simple sugar transport system permease protein
MSGADLAQQLGDLALASVRMATPLAFAGLGEAWSERAGLLNIGLEAVMLCGAFAAFLVAAATGSPWLGVAAGALAGCAVALVHAFLSVTCRADQTVAGLALNFLASGVTSFAFLRLYGRGTDLPSCPVLAPVPIPGLASLPVIGRVLFQQSALVYLGYAALALSWVVLSRTEWGTRLHAVGENPRAADSVGLPVARLRYLAAAVNGALGGLGGAALTVAMLGFFQENVTGGRGYIALVVVILGRRHPAGVALAALMLGAADALQFRFQAAGVAIPSQVFVMLPYVATIVVLLFTAGRARPPAALGVPFDRAER